MSLAHSPAATSVAAGELHVVGDDGTRHTMTVPFGSRLMPALRARGVGVIGMCGGNAACGTCHVYVADEWLDALPAPDGYEEDMLDELTSRESRSRLACQIVFNGHLNNLELSVAPHD